jgi:hypothetical protein
MSKKRALDYQLSYVHYRSRPEYVNLDFIGKKDKRLMSSVSILLNLEYFNEDDLKGFVKAR